MLSEQEMAQWLIEIHMAEQRLTDKSIHLDTGALYLHVKKKDLLDTFGLTDTIVKASYQYYMNRPKQLEAVYDIVIDSLNLREARFKESLKAQQ